MIDFLAAIGGLIVVMVLLIAFFAAFIWVIGKVI